MARFRRKAALVYAVSAAVLLYFVVFLTPDRLEHTIGRIPEASRSIYVNFGRRQLVPTLYARRAEWERHSKLSDNKNKTQRLPDVIGIGVKKCGTDAVISFLSHHPYVKTPANVETFFFNKNYQRGMKYYASLMPMIADHELLIEKTPAYFDSPPIALPYRISRDLPNAKIILVLCEPVKRSFSDYTHERARYKISELANVVANYDTFDAYLDEYLNRVNAFPSRTNKNVLYHHMQTYYNDHASTILSTGFYSVYLRRWTELFHSEKLLILDGEDLLNDPGLQVERMQEFLGIPKLLLARDFVRSPLTGLFCIRPWWKNSTVESESDQTPDLRHAQLSCLSDTKGRTRHSNGSVIATKAHLASLKELYRHYNRELYTMTGINYGM